MPSGLKVTERSWHWRGHPPRPKIVEIRQFYQYSEICCEVSNTVKVQIGYLMYINVSCPSSHSNRIQLYIYIFVSRSFKGQGQAQIGDFCKKSLFSMKYRSTFSTYHLMLEQSTNIGETKTSSPLFEYRIKKGSWYQGHSKVTTVSGWPSHVSKCRNMPIHRFWSFVSSKAISLHGIFIIYCMVVIFTGA